MWGRVRQNSGRKIGKEYKILSTLPLQIHTVKEPLHKTIRTAAPFYDKNLIWGTILLFCQFYSLLDNICQHLFCIFHPHTFKVCDHLVVRSVKVAL